MRKTKTKIKGQYTIMFLALAVPLFILMMMVTYDFGNFLLMRTTTRAIADSAALAAAGAVDMGGIDGTTGGTNKGYDYTLNETWAASRVWDIIEANNKGIPPHLRRRMSFEVSGYQAKGKEAVVAITGSYIPLWSSYSDPSVIQTTVVQRAEAATGTNEPK